jgi:DNA-directed RNA polymerase specialized sigma24 family protein
MKRLAGGAVQRVAATTTFVSARRSGVRRRWRGQIRGQIGAQVDPTETNSNGSSERDRDEDQRDLPGCGPGGRGFESRRSPSSSSPREREAVRLRFEDDLTQTEIGARLGLSQMQISRILRRALTSLWELAGDG